MRLEGAIYRLGDEGTITCKPVRNGRRGDGAHEKRGEGRYFLDPSLALSQVGMAPCEKHSENATVRTVEGGLLQGHWGRKALCVEEVLVGGIEGDDGLGNIRGVEDDSAGEELYFQFRSCIIRGKMRRYLCKRIDPDSNIDNDAENSPCTTDTTQVALISHNDLPVSIHHRGF